MIVVQNISVNIQKFINILHKQIIIIKVYIKDILLFIIKIEHFNEPQEPSYVELKNKLIDYQKLSSDYKNMLYDKNAMKKNINQEESELNQLKLNLETKKQSYEIFKYAKEMIEKPKYYYFIVLIYFILLKQW